MSEVKHCIKNAICPLCGTEIHTYGKTGSYRTERYAFDLRCQSVELMELHGSLHHCSNCGYVFNEEDKIPTNASETIKTEAYKTCDGLDLCNEPTVEKYYKYALIQLQSENFYGAFYAFLFGAWVCDDRKNKELSIVMRKKALEVFDILWGKVEISEGFYLVRADLLRRVGDFETVIKDYSNFDRVCFRDDRVMIARIQVMLAKDYQDDRCHYIPDYSALLS